MTRLPSPPYFVEPQEAETYLEVYGRDVIKKGEDTLIQRIRVHTDIDDDAVTNLLNHWATHFCASLSQMYCIRSTYYPDRSKGDNMKKTELKPLQYIRNTLYSHLGMKEFRDEWNELSTADKEELMRAAKLELSLVGEAGEVSPKEKRNLPSIRTEDDPGVGLEVE